MKTGRDGYFKPSRPEVPASAWLRQFYETIVTHQRLARAFQSAAPGVVGS